MSDNRVIIIGSGLGGLLCGLILGREGFEVTVLEKEPRPGGNLQTFTRNGTRFETGVHYVGGLGEGQTLFRYWKYLGLTGAIRIRQLDEDGFDHILFNDREFLLAQGFDRFRDQMLSHFPGERDGIDGYLGMIREVADAFPLYNLRSPGNHAEHLYHTRSARDFLAGLPAAIPPAGTVPLASVLAGNNYLFGGDSRTPLSSASLISHSFISGASRFVGGSGQVAAALVSMIRSAGGSVVTGQEVTRILPAAEGFSVHTRQGSEYMAGRVISGIHPAVTLSMTPDDRFRPVYRERIGTLPETPSPFILFLSLRPRKVPYFNHNYYYHSSTSPWDEAGAGPDRWPVMYLVSAGCEEPDQEYARSVTVMTYLPWASVARWSSTVRGSRSEDYLEFKEQLAARLLDSVSQRFPDLTRAVEHTEISTPLTYRDYTGTPGGSLYGIQKSHTDAARTSVLPRTKVPGFYFTGQNTNLHGVLGVTIGAVATCGEILGFDYLLNKINHG